MFTGGAGFTGTSSIWVTGLLGCLQVGNLNENAETVAEEHPVEAEMVQQQLAGINTAWDDLKQMVSLITKIP